MKKLLDVHYTPRKNSNTNKLRKLFLDGLKEDVQIIEVDLVRNPPNLLLDNEVNAYHSLRYLREDISSSEENYLLAMKSRAEELKSADALLLTYPIYNFTLPATVKAWIDQVVYEGITFRDTTMGPEGLMIGKKALVLNTSAGMNKDSGRDFSTPYIKVILKYIGFSEVFVEGGFGIRYTGITDEITTELFNRFKNIKLF